MVSWKVKQFAVTGLILIVYRAADRLASYLVTDVFLGVGGLVLCIERGRPAITSHVPDRCPTREST
jgi:hypothetical protein